MSGRMVSVDRASETLKTFCSASSTMASTSSGTLKARSEISPATVMSLRSVECSFTIAA